MLKLREKEEYFGDKNILGCLFASADTSWQLGIGILHGLLESVTGTAPVMDTQWTGIPSIIGRIDLVYLLQSKLRKKNIKCHDHLCTGVCLSA